MGEILTAVLTVSAVGLFFGIVLVIAAKFFYVKEDETAAKISEVLPGANCGGCGYSGCSSYAKAIAKGEADLNLCLVGGNELLDKLSEICGKTAEAKEPVVACVLCRGTCDITEKRHEYEGVTTCKGANMLYSGDGSCAYGCLGYGDCVKACVFGAIKIVDGVARVDKTLCRGCSTCVNNCPKGVIKLVPTYCKTAVLCSSKDRGADTRKACKGGCIGCKKCEKECPSGAITVVDNHAVIDYSKCDNCGHCAEACPTGVIYGKKG